VGSGTVSGIVDLTDHTLSWYACRTEYRHSGSVRQLFFIGRKEQVGVLAEWVPGAIEHKLKAWGDQRFLSPPSTGALANSSEA
jgi:hypothetical protein